MKFTLRWWEKILSDLEYLISSSYIDFSEKSKEDYKRLNNQDNKKKKNC